MQWKNPDGSITEGVVIEDGAGDRFTLISGGGGGGRNRDAGPGRLRRGRVYAGNGRHLDARRRIAGLRGDADLQHRHGADACRELVGAEHRRLQLSRRRRR